MKVGMLLSSFRPDPERALAQATHAEEAGLDGVFCYDHVWPMGQPGRPALAPFPLLAAVAATTERLFLGTLVARIGLVPDEVLLGEFGALGLLASGRVIAGLGTGDHLSADENAAYGVPMAPVRERRASLERCASQLVTEGFPVWIGAGRRVTPTVAAAHALGGAVNLWGVPPDVVAAHTGEFTVTWAGPCPELPDGGTDVDVVRRLVVRLAGAGATWAVFAGAVRVDALAAAAAEAARAP